MEPAPLLVLLQNCANVRSFGVYSPDVAAVSSDT